jgi:hypothetical protein
MFCFSRATSELFSIRSVPELPILQLKHNAEAIPSAGGPHAESRIDQGLLQPASAAICGTNTLGNCNAYSMRIE